MIAAGGVLAGWLGAAEHLVQGILFLVGVLSVFVSCGLFLDAARDDNTAGQERVVPVAQQPAEPVSQQSATPPDEDFSLFQVC